MESSSGTQAIDQYCTDLGAQFDRGQVTFPGYQSGQWDNTSSWVPDLADSFTTISTDPVDPWDALEITLRYEGVVRNVLVDKPQTFQPVPRVYDPLEYIEIAITVDPIAEDVNKLRAPQPRYGWRG